MKINIRSTDFLPLFPMKEELIVTKVGGQRVPFSQEKLEQSMRNAGANEAQIAEVITAITPKLYPGISTKKIYRWAFNKLKQRSKRIAAKYKLKKAIMELGPEGFIFEKFVAELLKMMGYHTKNGSIVQGKCITHEIDVIASSAEEKLLIECKYHSQQGKISDVKVPLYIHSRFQDVLIEWQKSNKKQPQSYQCWVVTNTRFSPDATQYASCMGMKLIGWDYPINGGIKTLIDQSGLYPVTCLTTLTRREKDDLLAANILLCSDLSKNLNILQTLRLSDSRFELVKAEVLKLTSYDN